ncbi:folylpolyglutamate synthase [Terramyces sp. JEL0728]|nr:folylpolyglutamate synthase [Terramyces sp. JEL0728]
MFSTKKFYDMIELKLESILSLLKYLGNPHKNLKTIHLAGTNGKGSTSTFISSILSQQYKTAIYNSPHLLEERDAIKINSKVIDLGLYSSLRQKVLDINSKYQINASAFEITTAVAFMAYQQEKVDFAVIEVGLGGLLDATNVIDAALVSVICKIDLDHTEFLGNSIKEIARHKAGIIKKGTSVVVAPNQHQDAIAEIKEQAAICDAPVYFTEKTRPEGELVIGKFRNAEFKLSRRMLGSYQLENIATALKTVEILDSLGYPIKEESVIKGVAEARIAGRLERIRTKYGDILVDGAHNAGGALALSEYINSVRSGPITWIVGFSSTKDPKAMLDILVKDGDVVYPVKFRQPPGMSWISCFNPQDLVELHPSCVECGEISLAFEKADFKNQVVVCGSLYLVAELYRYLKLEV